MSKVDALVLIADERERQQTKEGWTEAHDDGHSTGDLALAAACYALPEAERQKRVLQWDLRTLLWPWTHRWWKPTPNDRVRELVKAGALIVAEIERLQRAASGTGAGGRA